MLKELLLARVALLVLFTILLVGLSACTPTAGALAGGSWQSSGLTHQHIRVLEVDANNPQMVYAGDAQGKVFVSTDGGQHWLDRSSGLPVLSSVNALSFDATGMKLYAATSKGVFVSTNSAQHWSDVSKAGTGLFADSYTALAFDLNAQHTIYLGTAHHAVLVSTNDGQTWTALSNGLPSNTTINALAFDTDRHQLWAATDMGIYRLDARRTVWQALNIGLPANIVVYIVQLASTSGGVPGLIFAGTNEGFFRSEDFGMHWAQSQQSLARTNVRAIFVDFRSPTSLFVGTDVGVLRSDDSGQNWGGIAPGLPRNQPIYALNLGASGYAQLFAANNDIYLFPGTSGGLNITNVVPILLVLLFFYLLYRLTARTRRGRRTSLKPKRIIEQPVREAESDLDRKDNLT